MTKTEMRRMILNEIEIRSQELGEQHFYCREQGYCNSMEEATAQYLVNVVDTCREQKLHAETAVEKFLELLKNATDET